MLRQGSISGILMLSDNWRQLIMPDTMARFTGRARKGLNLALKEAEKLDDSIIHSGHLLLGLMQVDGSVSQAVLKKMTLSPDMLREKMEALIIFKASSGSEYLRIISLGSELKESLAYALDEARQRKDDFIGTEHLLLGLCRNESSLGMEILKQLNLSPQAIRQETLDMLRSK
jgi:ATP-dependent Clp protease ATP-binding subunit ClpC